MGKIIGGCITSIMHTKGTEYWPDFSGKILFLETPEGESFLKKIFIKYRWFFSRFKTIRHI